MKKLFIVCVVSILILGLAGCIFKEDAKGRIERLSNITLPEDIIEIYNFTDTTFTGVAGQYTVFKLSEKLNKFEGKEECTLSQNDKDTILYFLKDVFEVPEKYYIDFSEEYQYITGYEKTYVFYFPDILELIVFMGGH